MKLESYLICLNIYAGLSSIIKLFHLSPAIDVLYFMLLTWCDIIELNVINLV